jgi:hypothetical protein
MECCCCLYEYDLISHPPLTSSLCSHSLCPQCIYDIWLRNNGTYICPLCRAQTICPDSLNYTLLASLHLDMKIGEGQAPLSFAFDEIETALTSSGQTQG